MGNTICIFCGSSGADVKITREHTFSDWINTVLPTSVVGPEISYELSVLHGPQAGASRTWPAREVASHKLRNVCGDCNSGWMRRAEDAVAPIITPMIEGRPAELTTDQQLTIATWAALKAAVFEYVWAGDPVLTAADRELIMTQDRAPATVQVRLSSVESDGYPLRARGLVYLVRETGEKIMCLTMTIGCLVIQVFGGPGAGTDALRSAGRTGADFAAIFPPQAQSARWPPPAVLGDETLSAFADPLAPLADRSP